MTDIYIAGIAMTVFGRHFERSLEDLAREALDGALQHVERLRHQALDRAGLDGSAEDKGYEATEAALRTAMVLKRIRGA